MAFHSTHMLTFLALLGTTSATALSGQYMWITTAAQMGMGFILPFALTFVAIPLETFVHSLRTVVGLTAIAVLRFLSIVLRIIGNAFRYIGALAQQLYDLPLFIPLWLEERHNRNEHRKGNSGLREMTS